MDQNHYQLIVIGGGAAGFFGAITAAEHGLTRVLILEKSKEVLTKVRISGGGRCNVTHHCFDPKELVKNYPRGHRSLHGPFHRFQATDTIAWFENQGVDLVTESDGRMFPASNTSETIIQCLRNRADELHIQVRTRSQVTKLGEAAEQIQIETKDGQNLTTDNVLMATGGLRDPNAQKLLAQATQTHSSPVPSLFTFHIDDERLTELQGVSVPDATVKAFRETTTGPVLITHWGLSGPAILKLSAWGARTFAENDYSFPITINWTGNQTEEEIRKLLANTRQSHPTRLIAKRSLLEGISNRFWARLCESAHIPLQQTWANLSKGQLHCLVRELTRAEFQVTGKSTNKDEFVTCGGVHLKDLNLKTMASKQQEGFYYAGEVLDIDGVTGGFNFQAAWTTGYLAGQAIAAKYT